jgi:hypothetical protein
MECQNIEEVVQDSYNLRKFLLRTKRHGEELPVVSLSPGRMSADRPAVLWIDGRGKSALVGRQGRLAPEIRQLLDAGMAVIGADLLYQGEFLSDGVPLTEGRASTNPRAYAGYTFGYNDPLFAQRVHDILTLVSFARSDEFGAKRIHLVGVNGAGPWAAAARAGAGDEVDVTAIDTEGFRFADLESYRDVNFLPGAVKYGDLPALLALAAPHKLWISGETEKSLGVVTAAYAASRRSQNLTIAKARRWSVSEDIVQRLRQVESR